MELNTMSEQIMGAAIEVHKALGPGLLESAYEECLCRELTLRSIPFDRQISWPVLAPIYEAQGMTYKKLGGWKLGLRINLNFPMLKDGIRRRIL